MTLFKVEATFDKDNVELPNWVNVLFAFYIIADDEKEAMEKYAQAIAETPEASGMKNWKLVKEAQAIATNDCASYGSLLIE